MSAQWENVEFGRSAKPPVPMRIYEGTKRCKVPALVLYLRGGAFLEEERQSSERCVAKALADTGAVVLEADYSSVSSNVFPKAMECAFQALDCLSSRRKQFGSSKSLLIVAGDEAGGNVAAGVALKARDRMPGELDGQVLLSPMIDPMMTSESFRKADEIGMRQRWSDGWSHYLGSFFDSQHPYAAPCLCSRLSGVAPALVVTSEDDPLRDEGVNYAKRLSGAGVQVRQKVFPSGQGWTGIYRSKGGQDGGPWLSGLCDEFNGFVRDLSA
ncbi:alpha/beta hydrolase [Neorhizobium lilium]|uniref:Alpha/beta hydrolase n=1 Tax=Neorhizobium lilium TaxID=2503024 RepID=A0A3S3RHW4_9HYPH|nr:alpha/beta hydrolase [Neorhizobium lilium]RWX78407.1 alpha/beta hydrolase [Neorhizobium lilium]